MKPRAKNSGRNINAEAYIDQDYWRKLNSLLNEWLRKFNREYYFQTDEKIRYARNMDAMARKRFKSKRPKYLKSGNLRKYKLFATEKEFEGLSNPRKICRPWKSPPIGYDMRLATCPDGAISEAVSNLYSKYATLNPLETYIYRIDLSLLANRAGVVLRGFDDISGLQRIAGKIQRERKKLQRRYVYKIKKASFNGGRR